MISICLPPILCSILRHQWKYWRLPVENCVGGHSVSNVGPEKPTVRTWRSCVPCRKKRFRHAWRTLPRFSILRLLLLISGSYAILLMTSQIRTSTPYSGVQIWNPFKILGVTRFTSTAQLKRIYKKKSLRLHPDKNRGGSQSEEQFIQLTKAYKTLLPDTTSEG